MLREHVNDFIIRIVYLFSRFGAKLSFSQGKLSQDWQVIGAGILTQPHLKVQVSEVCQM